jgi:hypothetical protein
MHLTEHDSELLPQLATNVAGARAPGQRNVRFRTDSEREAAQTMSKSRAGVHSHNECALHK